MAGITAWLSRKLELKVNQQKSAVARPWVRKFLRFSFTKAGVPKRRTVSNSEYGRWRVGHAVSGSSKRWMS
jgi:RNA-directed DNA polymerase